MSIRKRRAAIQRPVINAASAHAIEDRQRSGAASESDTLFNPNSEYDGVTLSIAMRRVAGKRRGGGECRRRRVERLPSFRPEQIETAKILVLLAGKGSLIKRHTCVNVSIHPRSKNTLSRNPAP